MTYRGLPALLRTGDRVLFENEVYSLVYLDNDIALVDGIPSAIQIAYIAREEAGHIGQVFTIEVVPAHLIEPLAGNNFYLTYMESIAGGGF